MNRTGLFFVILAGCAPSTSKLDARIHDLEIQVAELRGRLAERQAATTPTSQASRESVMDKVLGRTCTPLDTTFPNKTTFDNAVAFDVGRSDVHGGDRIVITDVHGTAPELAQHGVYVVRGEYTLASADEAAITFTVTATNPNEGCTKDNPRARQTVKKGSGKFEVATTVAYQGHPHVWFDVGNNVSGGGVYFGKGDFLLK